MTRFAIPPFPLISGVPKVASATGSEQATVPIFTALGYLFT